MTNSESNTPRFYPILLIPYGMGFYLSLMHLTGIFILGKGIADPEISGFDLVYRLAHVLSNSFAISYDKFYFGMLITIILLSLALPFYCLIKNIKPHTSGWLLIANLAVSVPTLLLIFIGIAMNY
ncbi:hypothetical protein FJO98_15740 [Enterococcus sp. PF-2]|uniref:hypothetical protein n=1 Tax=Enterococcus TaxID=1350 RepID=UPI00076B5112|nr:MULTISPECIES: hypothetical protein [Enterococcus]AMG50634.1 hypothetical protein AL523_13190 [Enterococcus gallinarum]TPE00283.1 hypothetical protein FJP08_16175 [Enterococcus sp. PF-3]TPE23619.1 hypothetical protein FJO98_15740 [Enterococcus sp. PF-2]STP35032.1 Uncharacterised protein [Enterococcus casseliflavus]GEB28419.1 hypothetical protein ECA02_15140 [Enterococcus casseliflavus]